MEDYTRRQVAERLGISDATVDRLIREGQLPMYRVSPRRVRIPARAVEEYLARQRAGAGASDNELSVTKEGE